MTAGCTDALCPCATIQGTIDRTSPETGEPFGSEMASWVALYPTIGCAGDHQTSMVRLPEADATVAAGAPGKIKGAEVGIAGPVLQAAATRPTASASSETPDRD